MDAKKLKSVDDNLCGLRGSSDREGRVLGKERLAEVVREAHAQAMKTNEGKLASYIPELERVDPRLFGLSVCDVSGEVYSQGDYQVPFTLQSVSKVLAYACLLAHRREEDIVCKVGVEPTGEDFDSIVKLDQHRRAFNPMVNTGAIAVTDMLLSTFKDQALGKTLEFFSGLSAKDELDLDEAVFLSEKNTGERNRAIAHLLNNFRLLDNPVEPVLDLYFKHCSIRSTTACLAQIGATLANGGCLPGTGHRVLEPDVVRKVLSVMLSCGMYNDAGRWIYEVGLPAKSGVSGCLLVVVPGRMGIATYSPCIDSRGASVRGVTAVQRLSEILNLHLFAGAGEPPRP